MPRIGRCLRRMPALAAIACGALLAQACSVDLDAEPTATATATAVVFGPNDVAVGDLIDHSRAAWASVEAWNSETHVDSPASDDATGATSATTERVILPGNRHVLSMNGETVVTEEIVVDGRVYMRGTLVSSSIYPDVDAETWITFDAGQVPAGSVLDQRLAYLTSPPEFPFDTVTEETRALPARPAGETQVNGRTCLVYGFTTASTDDEGIDYRIAFDEHDRPCELVRSGGGVVETTTWTYPESPEPIAPPEDVVEVDEFPTAGA